MTKPKGYVNAGYTRPGKPIPPTAADVIHSLMSDSDCGGGTFAEFCGNLGYDEDSRRAMDTYLACQESGRKLQRVFTPTQLSELRKATEEL